MDAAWSALMLQVLSVLALLGCVGSQGDVCAESDFIPTTVTASTTNGMSLMQVGKARLSQQSREVPHEIGASIAGMAAVGHSFDGLHVQSKRFSMDLLQHVTQAATSQSRQSSNMLLSSLLLVLLVLVAICFCKMRPVASSSHVKLSGPADSGPQLRANGQLSRSTDSSQSVPQLGSPARNSPSAHSHSEGNLGAPVQISRSLSNQRGAAHNYTSSVANAFAPTLKSMTCPSWCADSKRNLDRGEIVVGQPEVSGQVVPELFECILAVPVCVTKGDFSIHDLKGQAVLHASTTAGRPWRLALQTATGESVAHCVEVRPNAANACRVEFKISDDKAELSASLMQLQLPGTQQRFQLTLQTGDRLHFWGNFQTQVANITDDKGNFVGTTEPCCGKDFDQTGAYYRLRMAPLVNVPQVLCAMLCISQSLNKNM